MKTVRKTPFRVGLLLALLLLPVCVLADHAVGTRVPAGTATGQIAVWSTSANGGMGGYVLNPLLGSQAANTFLAGPMSGSGTPSFRGLVSGDLPAALNTPWWQYIPAGGNTASEGYQYIESVTSPENSGTQDLIIDGGSRLHLRSQYQIIFDNPAGFGFTYGCNIRANATFTQQNNFTLTSNLNNTVLVRTGSQEDTVFQPYGPAYAIVEKAMSGQTRNLHEWQSPTGTVMANINPTGVVQAAGYKSSDGSAGETVTIPLAPLTAGGTQGSLTFKNGLEVSHVSPN